MNKSDYINNLKKRKKKLSLSLANKRTCGECQACCEVVGVHEFDKPIYTKCQHQCKNGCDIYSSRPESCQTYQCIWLTGFFDVEERPDKLGLVLDLRTSKFGEVISIWEVYDNAIEKEKTKEFLDKLSRKYVLYIRFYKSNKRRVMGPQDLVKKIGHVFEEMKVEYKETIL